MPASFFAGRLGLVSTPFGVIFFAGLMGLAYVSDQKHKKTAAAYTSDAAGDATPGASPLLWEDPTTPTAGDTKETFRKRAESVEW